LSGRVVAVLVNYNSGALLRAAVDSLLASAVPVDIEIVDNASRDDSLAFIDRDPERYARLSVRRNAGNLGFARANNQVMREREPDYFLLINPDCVVRRDTVGRLVDCLDADSGIGLAGVRLENPDGSIQKTSKRRFPTPWSALARTLGMHRLRGARGALSDFDLAHDANTAAGVEPVEAVSGALMFVRASALPGVGLLDEGYFMHCEDLDWCKRFWDAGWKVAYLADAGARHAKGGSGRGPAVVWYLHRSMLRFYDKHYRRDYPLPFSWLVYAAVFTRCALLMVPSLFRKAR